MKDLEKPVNSDRKNINAVISTVSLGLGVDMRVDKVVAIGMAESIEAVVQEGGRPKRGCEDGVQGFAHFLHKGLHQVKKNILNGIVFVSLFQ